MLLSIVVPVYNERATVLEVLDRVRAVDLPVDVEIIVVDDGSSDGTAEVLGGLPAQAGLIVEIKPRNGGKGTALRRGIELATGDYIVFQDADLELDPQDLNELLVPVLQGEATVVYGSRFLGAVNLHRNVNYWANQALTLLTNLLYSAQLTDMETCYKLLPAPFLKRLDLRSNGFEIEPELTAKALRLGHQIREVPIRYRPRSVQEGKKMRWRDGFKAVAMLVGQRLTPRRKLERGSAGLN